jgi:hypothetical protein
MTQLPMFVPTNSGEKVAEPVPVLPLARKTDPQTSQGAAGSLIGSKALGDMQRRALALVERYQGCTSNELSRLAGDGDPRRINRRLRELARADLIHEHGTKVDEVTGKRGLCWWMGKG